MLAGMNILRDGLRVMAAALVLAGAGCASRPHPVVETPETAAVQSWVRTELYFSIGDWSETALSTEAEMKWLKFLDAEVTPRFPDGLSVIDVYGQWRKPQAGAVTERERTRLLVVVHADTGEAASKIEAIRAAWKQLTGAQSVLRVSQPASVAF